MIFKGAVSFRFLQGLLTLMCNNSNLKADINCIFFVLRRHRSKVCNWLQKFFDSDTYMASPQNGAKIDLCGQ